VYEPMKHTSNAMRKKGSSPPVQANLTEPTDESQLPFVFFFIISTSSIGKDTCFLFRPPFISGLECLLGVASGKDGISWKTLGRP